jgi:hypothetical protein
MLLERKAQRQRIWAECMDKIAAVRPGRRSRGDFRARGSVRAGSGSTSEAEAAENAGSGRRAGAETRGAEPDA